MQHFTFLSGNLTFVPWQLDVEKLIKTSYLKNVLTSASSNLTNECCRYLEGYFSKQNSKKRHLNLLRGEYYYFQKPNRFLRKVFLTKYCGLELIKFIL